MTQRAWEWRMWLAARGRSGRRQVFGWLRGTGVHFRSGLGCDRGSRDGKPAQSASTGLRLPLARVLL